MKTFPADADDDEIRAAVAEWSELLAQQRYADALAMFEPAEPFTPEELGLWIAGYGCPEPDPDFGTFAVTSLQALPGADEIIQKSDEDRENLYGLDPQLYDGMVHYDDVPLNGSPSDLTARFHIRKVGDEQITLEFLDIHVM
jgi:hypothetical protein